MTRRFVEEGIAFVDARRIATNAVRRQIDGEKDRNTSNRSLVDRLIRRTET